jgi:hypothetical protein
MIDFEEKPLGCVGIEAAAQAVDCMIVVWLGNYAKSSSAIDFSVATTNVHKLRLIHKIPSLNSIFNLPTGVNYLVADSFELFKKT